MGKEREAVLEMLPYLRLGYVSDPSEMQTVLSSQGPICLVKSSGCYKLLGHVLCEVAIAWTQKKERFLWTLVSSLVKITGGHFVIMTCDILSSNSDNLISV